MALIIFILKHIQDNEFVILWTSGVKKIQMVNLFFFVSLIVFLFYLLLTTLITPLLLTAKTISGSGLFQLEIGFKPTSAPKPTDDKV